MTKQFNAYRRGVKIALTISPKASEMIDRLLLTGMYGRSRAAIAQELVYRGLREIESAKLSVRFRR